MTVGLAMIAAAGAVKRVVQAAFSCLPRIYAFHLGSVAGLDLSVSNMSLLDVTVHYVLIWATVYAHSLIALVKKS